MQLLWIVYVLVALVDLTFIGLDMPYRVFSKPLVLLVLLFAVMRFFPGGVKKHLLYFVALCFALLGDSFLLASGELSFLMGLGSFLLMQVIYTILFLRTRATIGLRHLPVILTILGLAVGLSIYLWPSTGELRIPVIAYTAAIVAMVIAGFLRKPTAGFWWIATGVTFFMVSDSILAINKFVVSAAWMEVGLMATYVMAQGCICYGMYSSSSSSEEQ